MIGALRVKTIGTVVYFIFFAKAAAADADADANTDAEAGGSTIALPGLRPSELKIEKLSLFCPLAWHYD